MDAASSTSTEGIGNVSIERLVLGAILLNEENYWGISDVLSLDCFGSDDHQKIFAVITELASDGRAIRVPLVAGRLGTLQDGQDADAYLSGLLHFAGKEDSIPLRDYAHDLRDAATRRRVLALAEGMIKSIKDPRLDAQSIVDRAGERIADISRSAAIEFETTVSDTIKRILKTASPKSKKGIALKPCLAGLEEMFGFFAPGSLVLWGGGPGAGKTAIAMQQLLWTSRNDPSSFFELEMDSDSLVARSIAGETGVSVRDIMRGMNEDQYARLSQASDDYSGLHLRMVNQAKMSIQQIRSRAYAHRRKHGLSLLVVDHLKLIERPSKTRIDPIERAYENARDLKTLAKDLGCVVIALCQFTKMARQKEQPEPEMEDFYGGSLEEHADLMLANFNRNDWLKKNPPKTNQSKAKLDWESQCNQTMGRIEVYKLKDRFGSPRDRKIFHWDGKKTMFSDLSVQQDSFDIGDSRGVL